MQESQTVRIGLISLIIPPKPAPLETIIHNHAFAIESVRLEQSREAAVKPINCAGRWGGTEVSEAQ
jgi:hypothetical protein